MLNCVQFRSLKKRQVPTCPGSRSEETARPNLHLLFVQVSEQNISLQNFFDPCLEGSIFFKDNLLKIAPVVKNVRGGGREGWYFARLAQGIVDVFERQLASTYVFLASIDSADTDERRERVALTFGGGIAWSSPMSSSSSSSSSLLSSSSFTTTRSDLPPESCSG